jgi:hypothetical protein
VQAGKGKRKPPYQKEFYGKNKNRRKQNRGRGKMSRK